MLKKGTKVINRKGLNYVIGDLGKPLRFKPWLGDAFSFLYDYIMRQSIFPRKFGSDLNEHLDILRQALQGIREKHVLELAPGSVFVYAVPVPERNTLGSTIRGTLLPEDGIAKAFDRNGFSFESIPRENGALLYFRATNIE